MSDPFDVVRDFENALSVYTGAPCVVTTTSCTMALFLALAMTTRLGGRRTVTIPKLTYIGVAQSVINAGHPLAFEDKKWAGWYELEGTNIIDSARYLSHGMYLRGTIMALSFHWSKHLRNVIRASSMGTRLVRVFTCSVT